MSKKNSRNTKSKIVSVFLVFVMVFSFFGCKTADEDGPTGEGTTTITDIAGADGKSATLMVYMVGSDLESKGGAATNDLQEMADSGVDLSKVNVVVYAGGSKKWHNDNISEDSGHTILQLTDKGFTTLETKESANEGRAEKLSEI
ncbi:MAG: hypothetical protein IKL09_01140 [Clostridia bacterium]|nr:hypothetical protein [Clostridia bacterium]